MPPACRNGCFLDAHQGVGRDWPGLRHANIIQTGEQAYCLIAEWDDTDSMAAARPQMIATLDTFRDTLDGGGGRGFGAGGDGVELGDRVLCILYGVGVGDLPDEDLRIGMRKAIKCSLFDVDP